MTELAFNCPQCNKLHIPEAEIVDRILECPNCQTQITVPEPVKESQIEGHHTVTSGSHVTYECPLCGNSKHMQKPRVLYNHVVCKKCYSGFANRRNLAYILDGICLYLFCFYGAILIYIVMLALGYSQKDLENSETLIGYSLIIAFLFKDCFSGYSLGKLICGVRVYNEKTGKPKGIGGSIMRTLPLFIPVIPIIVACQLPKGYRLGDSWSNTKVICKKYANRPIFSAFSLNN
ncbi:MAG: RDD family protein [Thermoguttaceae bacterium]